MPDALRVAAVQFEMAENDKAANLAKMEAFVRRAHAEGADVISFPEMCISGYNFVFQLDRAALLEVAEDAEDGPSVQRIKRWAAETGMAILFGLLEKDQEGALYNTYVALTQDGLLHKHRKVHAFENTAISQGDKLDTFELMGWTCGILICYDNNLPENGRVLALKGAQLIFAPHQTGGFDIERAGMGRIPLELWRNRYANPVPMRQAILGPKGKEWLMKWVPSRAYDNNCFLIFTNGVGMDGPEVRVGCSMVLNPEGIVLTETTEAEDAMITATVSKSELKGSLAESHMLARRPSLYGKLSEPAPERSTREIRNSVSGEKIR